MKFVLIALIASFSASAHASSLLCNTNDSNPRKGNTSIMIGKMVGEHRAEATQVTSGGMAHFVTAPEKFDVTVTAMGPENVRYENREKGFLLEVGFISMGGKLRGTLTTTVFGQKFESPVTCVLDTK